ncbi:SDR family oxidoreductase [Spirosoma montaniterrae]|uniref:NAD(P)-dependent oxidoreductase n=1 Tax=Spirosoma montaniterrae TaxID=1178516 RepID=A0A1P9WYK4_9BACT|nr:SDR family oxidoreductase [Spirosoma montaniterrae]AQG80456.1 NAD(P)-dependent oxidoreductase [Spirosoma montaniterrae]
MLPSTAERILITGASGNVGLETLRALVKHPHKSQIELLAGTRSPETDMRVIPIQPDRYVLLDFTDPATFDAALSGVRRVLLVRPPQLSDANRYFRPFVEAMKRAGVQHVVFLSLQGVENNPVTPHYTIEKLIVEAGLPFTFLRPSFFMQNLSTTHRDEIRSRNEIFIPAGNGRTSFVDVRDIGAVAALVLTDTTGNHLNRGYELTGSEALTYSEVAQMLTQVLGRKISYRNPSVVRFIWRKWLTEKNPLGFTLVMVALYTVSKLGKAARTTSDLERLLKRPPIKFRQFAMDTKAAWLS